MAKKSKGLLSAGNIERVAGAGAGAVAAQMLSKHVLNNMAALAFIPLQARPAIPVLAGLFLATQKGNLIQSAGVGMAAQGFVQFLQSFGIAGIGASNVNIRQLAANLRSRAQMAGSSSGTLPSAPTIGKRGYPRPVISGVSVGIPPAPGPNYDYE